MGPAVSLQFPPLQFIGVAGGGEEEPWVSHPNGPEAQAIDLAPSHSSPPTSLLRVQGNPPPPINAEETLGYVTCALAANSTKNRKKMGSSVAYKTIGIFRSQKMGPEDACGWATDRCKAVDVQRYANGRR